MLKAPDLTCAKHQPKAGRSFQEPTAKSEQDFSSRHPARACCRVLCEQVQESGRVHGVWRGDTWGPTRPPSHLPGGEPATSRPNTLVGVALEGRGWVEAAPAKPEVPAPGEPPRPALGGVMVCRGQAAGAASAREAGAGLHPEATPCWADSARGPRHEGGARAQAIILVPGSTCRPEPSVGPGHSRLRVVGRTGSTYFQTGFLGGRRGQLWAGF